MGPLSVTINPQQTVSVFYTGLIQVDLKKNGNKINLARSVFMNNFLPLRL